MLETRKRARYKPAERRLYIPEIKPEYSMKRTKKNKIKVIRIPVISLFSAYKTALI